MVKKGKGPVKRGKKASVRTPVNKLTGKETIEHYSAVLLGEIRSQLKLVVENAEGSESRLRSDLKTMEGRLGQEVELLKSVIHSHNTKVEIAYDLVNSFDRRLKEGNLQLAENGKRLTGIEEQLAAMERNLTDKTEAVHDRLDRHDVRITALERCSVTGFR